MNKIIKIIFVGIVLTLLVACGGGNNKDEESESNSSKIELDFWHAMTGENGESFEKIIEDFNKNSDEIVVKPVFQGSYGDIKKKLLAGGGSNTMPPLLMTNDYTVPFMIENNFATPLYELIENDEEFNIDELDEVILNRYKIEDKLYSMPISASTVLLYYNKDHLSEVGIELDEENVTFDDVLEYAEKLTTDDKYGFTMATRPWIFDQLLGNQGGLFVNNENGHSGKPTEALFNSEEGYKIFELLDDLNSEGNLIDVGREWPSALSAFSSGDASMMLHSSAAIRRLSSDSEFDIGVAYIPTPKDAEREGVAVGGNTVWITDKVSEEEKNASWEVIKYLSSSEVQAKWASETGYLPTNTESYEDDTLKEMYEEFPQMEVSANQLRNSNVSPATSGLILEEWGEVEEILATAIETLYQGNNDSREILDDAAEKTTKLLDH